MIAALSLFVATTFGAYASHGLAAMLDAPSLRSFQTAVDFQFYHSLGLLGVALIADRAAAPKAFHIAAYALVVGVVLFSGTIYAGAFGAPDFIGLAAPVGGGCLIGAWLICAFAAWRNHSGMLG